MFVVICFSRFAYVAGNPFSRQAVDFDKWKRCRCRENRIPGHVTPILTENVATRSVALLTPSAEKLSATA